jgi:hypothetical protein
MHITNMPANMGLSLLPTHLPMQFDVNPLTATVGTQAIRPFSRLPQSRHNTPKHPKTIDDFTLALQTETLKLEEGVQTQPETPEANFASWQSAFIAAPIFAAATATAIMLGIRMFGNKQIVVNKEGLLPIRPQAPKPETIEDPAANQALVTKKDPVVTQVPVTIEPLIDTIKTRPEDWAFVNDYHEAHEIALRFAKTDPENSETVLKLAQNLGNAIGAYCLYQPDMHIAEFFEIQETICKETGITEPRLIAAAIHVLILMGGLERTSLLHAPLQLAYIDCFADTPEKANTNLKFIKERYQVNPDILDDMYSEISRIRNSDPFFLQKDIPEFPKQLTPDEIVHSIKHKPDQWHTTSPAPLYFEIKKLLLENPEHGAKVAMLVQNWGMRIESDTRMNIAEMFRELVFASLELPFYVTSKEILAAMRVLNLTLVRNHAKLRAATALLGDELAATPDMTPEMLRNKIG